ncbi:MAG: TRAP transporter small permease [Burkholderiales bacterium]
MTRIMNWYFRGLRFFIAACLAGMVVLVFGNVVLRYAFNSGISVSEELSRWLFVWLTFVGAVIALRDHAHLGMDSVVSRLPAWGKKACFLLSNVLMLYCVWLFFQGSVAQVKINIGNMSPATGISQGWYYYSVGVFFSVMAAVLLLRNLWRAASGRISEHDLIQVRETEDEAKEEFLHKQEQGSGTRKGNGNGGNA